MNSFAKSLLCLALAVGLVAAWALPTFAQVTSGSLSGSVSDEGGGCLSGVIITANH